MAKFYICQHCGNIFEVIKDKCPAVTCCGEKITVLEPGVSDGAKEKHVPVWSVEGNKLSVKVGEAEHPMIEAHYIEWIAVETSKGMLRKNLNPGEAPAAEFLLSEGEEVKEVYAYCNLHSLFKS